MENFENNNSAYNRLEKAYQIEQDIFRFARLMDGYHLDGILGLLVPGGDLLPSLVGGAYTHKKAKEIGLSRKQRSKIIWRQVWDGLIGSIPVLGDIFDFFYAINKRNHSFFVEKLRELEQQARAEGVSESSILELKKRLEVIETASNKAKDIVQTTKGQIDRTL